MILAHVAGSDHTEFYSFRHSISFVNVRLSSRYSRILLVFIGRNRSFDSLNIPRPNSFYFEKIFPLDPGTLSPDSLANSSINSLCLLVIFFGISIFTTTC